MGHSKGPSKCQNNNYFFVCKNMSTMYISSFYRNIQKEFYTKDTKKSRLVKTIEYFDKSKKLTPKPSNEPEIRKISREMNHVSVSTQKPSNSTLLNRPTEKSNRFENSNRSSRRFSLAESQKRSRSLLRSTEVERSNLSQAASRIRKNSTQRRLSVQNTNFRYSRNIKSNKSTEGTKSKEDDIVQFDDEILEEETVQIDILDDATKRVSTWLEDVNKCMKSGNFNRKVVMDPSEINYPPEIERPESAKDRLPGNYHKVTIVQYDGDS